MGNLTTSRTLKMNSLVLEKVALPMWKMLNDFLDNTISYPVTTMEENLEKL